jgi:predicted RND superfamily exporter protein
MPPTVLDHFKAATQPDGDGGDRSTAAAPSPPPQVSSSSSSPLPRHSSDDDDRTTQGENGSEGDGGSPRTPGARNTGGESSSSSAEADSVGKANRPSGKGDQHHETDAGAASLHSDVVPNDPANIGNDDFGDDLARPLLGRPQPDSGPPRRPHPSLPNDATDHEDDDGFVLVEGQDDEGTGGGLGVVPLERVAEWIESYYPILLLAVMVLLWPVGFVSFRRFQSLTDSTFKPLPGTMSRRAQDAFAAAYSSSGAASQLSNRTARNRTSIAARTDWSDPLHPPLFIVLGARNGTANSSTSLVANASSPAYQAAKQYMKDLRSLLETTRWSWIADDGKDATNDTGTSNESLASASWFQLTDYFSLVEQDLSWMASAWATPDGSMLLAAVQYSFPSAAATSGPGPSPPSPSANATLQSPDNSVGRHPASNRHDRERIHEVMAAIEAFGTRNYSESEWFTVHYTGLPWFQTDLSASTRQDLRRMDYLVLPLAFVLMGMALHSANPFALWIVPLASMVTVVSVWSIVMCFVAPHVQITQFTPTIMMSLTLGLGIDYTLFLLARYLEVVAPSSTSPSSFLQPAVPLSLTYEEGPASPPLGSHNRVAAVVHMLRHGGKVIVLSGSTLICTFLGLCWLPLPMLKSVGIGAAVAIVCALLVNLTLVPALLVSPIGIWIVKPRHRHGYDLCHYLDLDVSVNSVASAPGQDRPRRRRRHDSASSSALLPSPPPSVWFRLSDQLLHPYRGLILLLVTVQVVLPIAMYAGKVKSSISFDLVLPRSSPALQTFQSLSDRVGSGRLNPVRVLFDARFATGDNNATLSMTSEQGFDVIHLVVDELLNMEVSAATATSDAVRLSHFWDGDDDSVVTRLSESFQAGSNVLFRSDGMLPISVIDPHLWKQDAGLSRDQLMSWESSMGQTFGFGNRRRRRSRDHVLPPPSGKPYRTAFNGIAVLQNARIPHGVFVTAKLCSQIKPHCPVEILHVLDALDSVVTSPYGAQATYVTATLGVDPFSDRGVAWLVSARKLIEQLEASGRLRGVHVHLQSSAAIEYDAQQAVYHSLPWMMFVTTAAVFILMGFFFQSFFLPLRSVVSIGLTLGFSFGLGVLVYEKGIGNWIGAAALSSPQNEFCWLVPVMSFSLIVGLALDYDVFLVSRILEYRLEGYEHKSSIAAALHSTGGIITAAGIIMAVAFGSLLFSSSAVLCQWSFLITAAVLFDTFVVRTVVVPIVTSLAGGKWCWWPREMPDPRVTMPEYVGGMDDVSGLLRTLERSSEYESLQAAAARSNGGP